LRNNVKKSSEEEQRIKLKIKDFRQNKKLKTAKLSSIHSQYRKSTNEQSPKYSEDEHNNFPLINNKSVKKPQFSQ
jgi:hypothetical protein